MRSKTQVAEKISRAIDALSGEAKLTIDWKPLRALARADGISQAACGAAALVTYARGGTATKAV